MKKGAWKFNTFLANSAFFVNIVMNNYFRLTLSFEVLLYEKINSATGETLNPCAVSDCCERGWFSKKLVENSNILPLRISKLLSVRESFGEVIKERAIHTKLQLPGTIYTSLLVHIFMAENKQISYHLLFADVWNFLSTYFSENGIHHRRISSPCRFSAINCGRSVMNL